MSFEVKSAALILNGRTLPIGNVDKAISDGERIFVLVDYLKSENSRNAVALALNGDELWRIQEETKRVDGKSSPYVNLNLQDDRLWALSFGGFEYEIDPTSGRIIGERFLK